MTMRAKNKAEELWLSYLAKDPNLTEILEEPDQLGEEYRDWQFELGGREGADFDDLQVLKWSRDGKTWHLVDLGNARFINTTLRFRVKVIAFRDEIAEERNWKDEFTT
jgi:hypothetical protein